MPCINSGTLTGLLNSVQSVRLISRSVAAVMSPVRMMDGT